MMEAAAQLACLECDLLLDAPELEEGERASCPRCGYQLMAKPRDGLTRSLSFALGAGVFLIASLAFPFMSFHAGGLDNVMTLPQTAIELYRNGERVVAILVMGFILLVPGALLCALLALLAPMTGGYKVSWLAPTARLIFTLGPWCMVEVFVIGVLVSLVKLMSLATVVLGISFWAYAAFSICFIAALASLDRFYIWDEIERRCDA